MQVLEVVAVGHGTCLLSNQRFEASTASRSTRGGEARYSLLGEIAAAAVFRSCRFARLFLKSERGPDADVRLPSHTSWQEHGRNIPTPDQAHGRGTRKNMPIIKDPHLFNEQSLFVDLEGVLGCRLYLKIEGLISPVQSSSSPRGRWLSAPSGRG